MSKRKRAPKTEPVTSEPEVTAPASEPVAVPVDGTTKYKVGRVIELSQRSEGVSIAEIVCAVERQREGSG